MATKTAIDTSAELANSMSNGKSLLINQYRNMLKKSKDFRQGLEAQCAVGYPTGFVNFDFRNGTIIFVKNEAKNMDFKYYSIGVTDGSMITVIGRSGCGKTTWTLQSAANIVRPFKTSYIVHEDIEGGIVDSRKQKLLGFYGEEFNEKYIARNTGITSENFYQRIKMLYDLKTSNKEMFEYDTGCFSLTGERIYKLEPTVVVLDSWAMLTSERYSEEEELSGQMSTTSTVKTNTDIIRKIIPMLKSANIILFVINHIRKKIEMNPFAKTKAQVAYLKPDEYLPGGDQQVYLSNTLIRFDDSKLKPDAYGIDGTMVDISLVKSRTSKAGQSCTMVFNQEIGFDNDLSTFVLLKNAEKIKGAGAYQYLDGYPDYKFTQKKFTSMMQELPEFRQIVVRMAFDVLSETLEEENRVSEVETIMTASSAASEIYNMATMMIPKNI